MTWRSICKVANFHAIMAIINEEIWIKYILKFVFDKYLKLNIEHLLILAEYHSYPSVIYTQFESICQFITAPDTHARTYARTHARTQSESERGQHAIRQCIDKVAELVKLRLYVTKPTLLSMRCVQQRLRPAGRSNSLLPWQWETEDSDGSDTLCSPLYVWINAVEFISRTGSNYYQMGHERGPLSIKHAGHHRPASETPFEWRLAGGSMVARLSWGLHG